MDHVIIEDECKIQNSVICTNAHISLNCNLNSCRVGESVTVPPATKEKNADMLDQADYA
jgi:ADP-glucose pyrophosphorylase